MVLVPLLGLATSDLDLPIALSDHVGWGWLGWKNGLVAENLIFEIRRHLSRMVFDRSNSLHVCKKMRLSCFLFLL